MEEFVQEMLELDQSEILNVYLYIARHSTNHTVTKGRGLHFIHGAIDLKDLIARENDIEAGRMGVSSKSLAQIKSLCAN